VVDLLRQIAEGLREAHRQKIIHRDLKPENIMIDESGNVKVMDFGIARLMTSRTLSFSVAGTPSYMSPEQLEGRNLDARSDIYTLGLVAYEMLTGRAAFSGNSPVSIAKQQMDGGPPAPRNINAAIPPELETFILRAIELEPARRYQSLDEFLAALPTLGTVPKPSQNPIQSNGEKKKETNSKTRDLFDDQVQIMSPGKARALLLVIQFGYLALYLTVLIYFDATVKILETQLGFPSAAKQFIPVIAMVGIAARIYLLSALMFNHPATGRQYWKLFPYLLPFDAVWAASPLLLAPRDWSEIGLALAGTVLLAYLPLAQKTLFSNAYR
jgi:serine/threonine protein kinase